MDKNIKRLDATIHGTVQGVGFRAFTRRTARSLRSVTGWVRNQPDGTVKLIAEGPADQLDELLESVGEGPRRARVQRIEKEFTEPRGEFDRFEVRY